MEYEDRKAMLDRSAEQQERDLNKNMQALVEVLQGTSATMLDLARVHAEYSVQFASVAR